MARSCSRPRDIRGASWVTTVIFSPRSGVLRLMRIDGENGWLEILLRDDEEAFDVRCAVGDFAGRNPHIWIDANEQRAFLSALRDLERERRGEARIAAMSPEEFELSIQLSLIHISEPTRLL